MSSFRLGWHIMKERLTAGRMVVIWILLTILVLFASWGFTDSNLNLTSNYQIDSAYDVLFVSTAATIWGSTLGAVLISFDGVSRDRVSGVLEIKLSQPMQRKKFAISLLLGHWGAILVPFMTLNISSILIIWYRIDELPTSYELLIYILASALLVFWWTSIQLLASSWAKDMGLSIALGLGVWITFILLWIIPTAVIAGFSGAGVENLSSPEYTKLQGMVDLFSPNGVYNHLMEICIDHIDRGVSLIYISISTILWTLVPAGLFIRRIERIHP